MGLLDGHLIQNQNNRHYNQNRILQYFTHAYESTEFLIVIEKCRTKNVFVYQQSTCDEEFLQRANAKQNSERLAGRKLRTFPAPNWLVKYDLREVTRAILGSIFKFGHILTLLSFWIHAFFVRNVFVKPTTQQF